MIDGEMKRGGGVCERGREEEKKGSGSQVWGDLLREREPDGPSQAAVLVGWLPRRVHDTVDASWNLLESVAVQ